MIKQGLISLFVAMLLGVIVVEIAHAKEPTVEYFTNIPADVISLTHGFANGIGLIPDNVKDLTNSPISNMLGLIVRIRDKDGNLVGLANELEAFPDDKGFRPEISWKTDWTIRTAHGSLYMYQTEQVPAAHFPAFEAVAEGKDWSGSLPAQVTTGPHSTRRGIVVGGTGVYQGVSGTFVESVELQGLTTAGKISGILSLQIYLDPK
ncbi:MAG: hypothetical protein JKY46_05775 [Robiginitomaculum sp.]|nr:hypothetical protein [Robiginitomaculum sp.]